MNYTDTSSVAHAHTEHFSITVRANWYAGLFTVSPQPNALTDLTNQGAFVEGDQVVLDNTSGSEAMGAYAWIPTADVSTAKLETTQGFDIPFTNTGTVTGDHTLIEFGTVDAGDSNTIEVGEV